MKITFDLFEAFLKCPTKCWLRAAAEPPSGNMYAEWVRAQTDSFRVDATEQLYSGRTKDEFALSPSSENLKAATWQMATNVIVNAQTNYGILESMIEAVERVPSEGQGRRSPTQYIPVRFVFTNKLNKDETLLLAFDALVLSKALEREITNGRIIHGSNHTMKAIKTSRLTGEVRKSLEKIATLLARPNPPDLILKRHCVECEYQTLCREKAIEKDDLSLLAGMSEKERKKLHSKGIFTVTQLSYTIRPRRRPKRLREKREKYYHSLKALAIREKKIHVIGNPKLKIGGYDSLPCRQQKCLVHLIRDFNDDLWKNPFDDEYEQFVSAVRDLIVPIIEDVKRYGLKSFHLRKHLNRVERFYKRTIVGCDSENELIVKYKKRFLRYKNSLFTFLENDGVSWNNNTAERAIRHLAVQRKISGAFSTNGATYYLRLLAIAQSCRFQEKSFLGFLLSGLKNVDAYKQFKRRTHTPPRKTE